MWIVTNKGLMSIVNKEGSYVVRSRTSADLAYFFPQSFIEEDSGTDYEYRVRINDHQLDNFFKSLKQEITYPNFKNSIKIPKLKDLCSELWLLYYKHFGKY